MGTIAEKLNYLNTTKANIKSAIITKGVSVSDTDTFRSYADKIANISSGGGDDWSKLGYPATHADYEYSKNIYDNWDATITDCTEKYWSDTTLAYFPLVDTYNVTNMSYMFGNCNNLREIAPQFDTYNVTNMQYMFWGCYMLKLIPELNTSNVTDMSHMFEDCTYLMAIPELDTSNVTDMQYMFQQCHSLTSIPLLDTHNVTNMENMFSNCYSLNSIPKLNTSNVTHMAHIFAGTALTSIPQLDTSKVVDMTEMFYCCDSLTSIPLLDTHNVIYMGRMFSGCTSLKSAQLSYIETVGTDMFDICNNLRTLVIGNTDVVPILKSADASRLGGLYTYATESTIYVPQSMISAYQTADGWFTLYSRNNNIFQPIEGSEYE